MSSFARVLLREVRDASIRQVVAAKAKHNVRDYLKFCSSCDRSSAAYDAGKSAPAEHVSHPHEVETRTWITRKREI
jgi:hypothetical protein